MSPRYRFWAYFPINFDLMQFLTMEIFSFFGNIQANIGVWSEGQHYRQKTLRTVENTISKFQGCQKILIRKFQNKFQKCFQVRLRCKLLKIRYQFFCCVIELFSGFCNFPRVCFRKKRKSGRRPWMTRFGNIKEYGREVLSLHTIWIPDNRILPIMVSMGFGAKSAFCSIIRIIALRPEDVCSLML